MKEHLSDQNIELSAVILCYRAGKRVYDFAEKITALLDKCTPFWEAILVGNCFENSIDETPHVVREIASKHERIHAVTMYKKGMMGWDARSGLNMAKGKFICLIDGDEQMPAEDIGRVFDKIKNEKLDFVTTYRTKRFDGILRVICSVVYNLIAKVLFPGIFLKDINSKPKIFTKEAFNQLRLTSNDWFLDAEIAIQCTRLKFKIGQIPTVFYKSKYRRSFVNVSTIYEFAVNLLRTRIRGYFK